MNKIFILFIGVVLVGCRSTYNQTPDDVNTNNTASHIDVSSPFDYYAPPFYNNTRRQKYIF